MVTTTKNSNLRISLLVGLKNNVEYSQFFYRTTRNLYPKVEIVFASYGSTDNTHRWLDSLEDNNLKYYYSAENKSLSDTYNKCIELATSEYVVFLHNDMVLTPFFLENLDKHLDSKTIVSYSVIEPPIYADNKRIGKIIHDFGSDINSFNSDALYQFSAEISAQHENKIAQGIGLNFFISLNISSLLAVNGLDNLFSPMFFEDDDLLLRLEELGLNEITSLDAICYHFVSKTSRFTEEVIQRTKAIENNSRRNFIRKWGFTSYNAKTARNEIAIILRHATADTLSQIEPYCSHLYVDCSFDDYIAEEQPKTKFRLSERIHPIDKINNQNIVLEINGDKIDRKTIKYLGKMNRIINQWQRTGYIKRQIIKFKLRNKGIAVKNISK